MKLHGDGFIVTPEQAASLDPQSHAIACGYDLAFAPHIRTGVGIEPQVLFAYRNGRDLASRPRGVMAIDLFGLSDVEVRRRYPAIYQHLANSIRPHREGQFAKSKTADARKYAEEWWLFGKTRPEIRKALTGVSRYIATVETAKHRVFQFLPKSTLPDNMLICIALDDAYHLGVLSSRFHVPWATGSGGRMGVGDDPRYSKTRCFDPFPFPSDVPEPMKIRIRTEAEAPDGLRKQVLAAHEDLTLTGLYNVLEALRTGRVLTAKEREVHDHGLVTLIRQHHDAVDAAVAEAYGWPPDLSDEEILVRLVALNRQRAAEEAKGVVRWLRPDFQAPGAEAPIKETLDLGQAAPALVTATILAWPKTLPEQVTAVALVLAGASAPLSTRDVVRAFAAKRAATVTPVLDALAAIGQARRLEDGRYAA